jgi:hypothetical protein
MTGQAPHDRAHERRRQGNWAVAGAITMTVVSTYPPGGPVWRYLAYTAVPVCWLVAGLMQPGVLHRISEWYGDRGPARVPIAVGGAMLSTVMLVLWVLYLPNSSISRSATSQERSDQGSQPLVVAPVVNLPEAPERSPAQNAIVGEPVQARSQSAETAPPAEPPVPSPPRNARIFSVPGNPCDQITSLIPEGRALDDTCRATECTNVVAIADWTANARTTLATMPAAVRLAFDNPPQQAWVVHGFPASGPRLRFLHDLNWRWQFLLRVLGSPTCSR